MSGTVRVRPTQILVVLALTNLVAYAARNALFAVYPDLTAHYHIDNGDIGFLQTVFMIPHAAATLPFGWAGDRYDRRRVIALGMVIASVAGALGALTSSYWGLAASRAFVGFGTAAVVPVANSILGQIYEGPKKASRLSIFNLGLFLGGVAGFAVGIAVGFPMVVVVISIPGIVLAALIVALPVETESPTAAQSLRIPQAVDVFLADARILLRIRTLRWLVAGTTAMAFAAGGYNAWLQQFLVTEKHMSKDAATTLLTLALCGGLSGILVGGRIADRLRARTTAGRLWTVVLGITLTIPCAAVALEIPPGPGLYIAGVATMFFISWYHAPMAATVDDLAPLGRSVSAQGLVIFTMHMFGTSPSSWIVGEVADRHGLHFAMWVPTSLLVLAVFCMGMATVSFAADHARSRGTAA